MSRKDRRGRKFGRLKVVNWSERPESTYLRWLKTLFSQKLKSRTFDRQAVEARVRCAALNRMTELGMPRSYVA